MRVRRGPVMVVAGIALAALLVPLLPLADPSQAGVAHSFAPSLAHPLGNDEAGRDELSRLLWGGRTSLLIAGVSAMLAWLAGSVLGLARSSCRPVGIAIDGSMEVLLCFPPLLFALLIIALRGPGMAALVVALAALCLPGFVRMARRGAGAMPIQLVPAVGAALILEAGLSFLGLGVMPPAVSWGQMIGEARPAITQAPLLTLWPSAALILTVLAVHGLYTALRYAAEPSLQPARQARIPSPPPSRPTSGTAVLDVRKLTIEVETPHGVIRPVRDVSLTVHAGETVALIGEPGPGKSLIGLALMGLLPESAYVAQGSAWLQGHNLLRLDDLGFRRVRGGIVSLLFQDSACCFDPMQRIGRQISEAMHAHFEIAAYEAKEEVETLLARVGIAEPKRCARAWPHQLSADGRQRAMVAMAIANDPRLLIVDEPDPGVLDLLADLRRELGMGLVLVGRDVSLAAVADRVLVLRDGTITERRTEVSRLHA